MKEIIECSELPENEKVYMKKDILGWRVVEPWKNPETEEINWFRLLFGGKRALFALIVCLIIVALLYFGILELIGQYKAIAMNPCDYCQSINPLVSLR